MSTRQFTEKVERSLQVAVVQTTIAGTNLVGAMVAMNTRGIVASRFTTEEERGRLSKGSSFLALSDKFNAAGNNIVVNDRGAVVNPDMTNKSLRQISDVLGVEAVKGTVAGLKTVGSACIANNNGALCHPEITDAEIKLIEDVLKVKAKIGTVSYGVPLVGACLLSNSKGALTGSSTTPIEIGRIEDALGV
jgi:translation initiation factor 6